MASTIAFQMFRSGDLDHLLIGNFSNLDSNRQISEIADMLRRLASFARANRSRLEGGRGFRPPRSEHAMTMRSYKVWRCIFWESLGATEPGPDGEVGPGSVQTGTSCSVADSTSSSRRSRSMGSDGS